MPVSLLNYKITFSHLTSLTCLVFRNVPEEGLTVLVGKKVSVHQTVCNHNQSLFWIPYCLVTCPVEPYVHLDASHVRIHLCVLCDVLVHLWSNGVKGVNHTDNTTKSPGCSFYQCTTFSCCQTAVVVHCSLCCTV
jgi:hypothetical protein